MLVVNGHGGNAAAITHAARQLQADGRACHSWHAGLPGHRLADPHAGRFETSLLLALAPSVRLDLATPGDMRPLAEIMPELRAHGVRAVSPSGVLGDPAGASADEGESLLGQLVASLNRKLDIILAD